MVILGLIAIGMIVVWCVCLLLILCGLALMDDQTEEHVQRDVLADEYNRVEALR